MSNVSNKLQYLKLLMEMRGAKGTEGRVVKMMDSIEVSLTKEDELDQKINEAKLQGIRDREARWNQVTNQ